MKILSFLLLAVLFLASCAPDAPGDQANPVDDFVTDLEEAGATVDVGGETYTLRTGEDGNAVRMEP